MIWDTSIWRLACWNPWKIPSAQKCYPCNLSRCPGVTCRFFAPLSDGQVGQVVRTSVPRRFANSSCPVRTHRVSCVCQYSANPDRSHCPMVSGLPTMRCVSARPTRQVQSQLTHDVNPWIPAFQAAPSRVVEPLDATRSAAAKDCRTHRRTSDRSDGSSACGG